jgi:dTDP-4-dehydrorhamnose 3,5-epimerase
MLANMFEFQGMYLLSADIHSDERGKFRRHFCHKALKEQGIDFTVAQANISENTSKWTLRGFHYQNAPYQEQKILTVLSGKIFNVTVDMRPESPTFLRHVSRYFSASDRVSLLIPAGTANAFLTCEDNTLVHYYMSENFTPSSYNGFHYLDPVLGIDWPQQPEVISDRDDALQTLKELGIVP